MKYITENEGNLIKLISLWRDTHKNFSFYIYPVIFFIGISIPFSIFVALGMTLLVFPWFFIIFIICSISIFLIPIYYFLFSKDICIIDLKKRQFLLYKIVFGRSKLLKILPFLDCKSINSSYDCFFSSFSPDLKIWKIFALSKKNVEIDLIKIKGFIQKKKKSFYHYYFDLLIILIYRILKGQNIEFDIEKNLVTKDKDLLSLNFYLEGIRNLAKIFAIDKQKEYSINSEERERVKSSYVYVYILTIMLIIFSFIFYELVEKFRNFIVMLIVLALLYAMIKQKQKGEKKKEQKNGYVTLEEI